MLERCPRLLVAGLLEVVWAYTMKLSDGFSRPWPSVITLLAMFASFGLLSLAMRALPLETLHAVGASLKQEDAFGYEIKREALAEVA